MKVAKIIATIVFAAIMLWLFSANPVMAAAEQATSVMNIDPLVLFFGLLIICILIGVIAALGGVGGGVVFTPLMMGFTPIDSYIIRATGLLAALTGSLVAARPFLNRGLANIRLLLFASVPYSIFAVIGAVAAGYVKATAGDFGEALIRLILGILVMCIAFLILFGGKRVEYPEVKKIDGFTQRLNLNMSYWEQSLGKIVDYAVKRAPLAVVLFCFTGLISGMFGMGAGWAMVPVLNLVMQAPLKVAAASSSVLIGIGDTAAVWPYISGGGIFPLIAIPCMIGLIIGMFVGTRIMLKVRAGFTRWIVIFLMFASGIKLVIDGVTMLQ